MNSKLLRPTRWVVALVAILLIPFGLEAQEGPRMIESVVRDAGSGQPLSAVRVRAGDTNTATDAHGRFRLIVEGETTLVFERLGYETLRLPAEAVGSEVRFAARPVLLDGLVVLGERRHALAVGTSLTVESADGSALSARGAATTAESLAGMEGVSIARPGAWGAKASLRGLGGERVAVMVDGNRVNRACSGGMDQGLATIDPSTIERVEVLSGPGSTLYGSGNIGGVINVVTRRASPEPGVSGEVRAGGSTAVPGGTSGATLRLGGDRWSAAASFDGSAYGDYRTPDGVVDGTSFRQGTGDLKVDMTPVDGHRTQLQAQAFEGRDIGWPGAPGHEMSIPEESRRFLSVDHGWQISGSLVDALSVRAFVQHIDHHMSMRMDGGHHGDDHDQHHGQRHPMHAGHGGHDEHGHSPAAVTVTDALSASTTTGGRVQTRLLPGAASHVDLGVEVTAWHADGTRWSGEDGAGERMALRSWPGVRIVDTGLFAQGEHRPVERIALTGGARIDRVTRRSEAITASDEWVRTGNIGARADLGVGLSLRTAVGVGYRIPDPTELFGAAARPDGYLYRGNPELSTETNRNAEVSLGYDAARFGASATAFRNDLHDFIAPTPVHGETVAGRPVMSYENLTRGRLTGATARVRVEPMSHTELRSTASYVRGVDLGTGAPLPQVPPLEGSLVVRHTPSAALSWLEIEGRGAAGQSRVAPGGAEVGTPEWFTLDLRTGFDLGGVEVVAGMANVLDARYRAHLDPVGLFQPGRNLFLRMTRSF